MSLFFLLVPVLALGSAGAAASAAAVTAPATHRARPLTSLTATRPAGRRDRGTGETAGAISNSCRYNKQTLYRIPKQLRPPGRVYLPGGQQC